MKIYFVPSPIGNLEDITFRSIEVLKNADLILCEDTRTSSKLLQHYSISKPLKSFHIHNEHAQTESLLKEIKNQNLTVAVLSDAGTPGISDPGFLLARHAIDHDIPLECLPGPTALIPALVISGLPSHEFRFIGFLPAKKGRRKKIEEIAEHDCTTILYESPHRINSLLRDIEEILGKNIQMSLSRELSKIYEETLRGSVEEIRKKIGERKLKGEMVVLLHPNYKYENTGK